jgi:undecaprenyl-diphosphatase
VNTVNLKRNLRTFPWRRQIICIAPLGVTLIFLAVFFGTGNDIAGEFARVREGQPALTRAVDWFSDYTQYAFFAVWLIVLIRALKEKNKKLTRKVLYFILAELVFATVVVRILKVSVGYPRPKAALKGATMTPFSLRSDHNSFPSGHTVTIAIAGSCTAFQTKSDFIVPLLMGVILAGIGFSRIYLGSHHILDVSAALLIGALGNFCFHCLCNRERNDSGKEGDVF